jgi:hypothetical protein
MVILWTWQPDIFIDIHLADKENAGISVLKSQSDSATAGQ